MNQRWWRTMKSTMISRKINTLTDERKVNDISEQTRSSLYFCVFLKTLAHYSLKTFTVFTNLTLPSPPFVALASIRFKILEVSSSSKYFFHFMISWSKISFSLMLVTWKCQIEGKQVHVCVLAYGISSRLNKKFSSKDWKLGLKRYLPALPAYWTK